jgi:RHS repeat-associated protein
MHALAQTADGRRHTRAANDDDYFGGPRTRTKYTYDANGNRLTRAATVAGFTAQTLGYTASSNRMSAFNGTSVTYDGLGNLSSGVSAAALSYGANTRLAQVAEYSNDLYLTYNGLGELARTLQTTEDGCGAVSEINREYYHFATDGRALALVQESSQRVQWDWLWLDNLPVLQFEDSYDGAGTLIGTTATYLHPDHLGTPRIGTDTAGTIQWRYRSDGFGTLTNANSREVRLRLPGQIALGLGAINYNYFRDYDPSLGRYLESDPIGLQGGINTYAYVQQNPLSGIDPTGEATIALPLPRPIPLPGPAAGIAGAGIGGYAIGSEIYPSIAQPLGNAIDKVCGNDPDFCYNRWQSEFGRCWQWKRPFGMRWVRACQDRARYRMQLCVANGGRPDPNEPPEWSPFRDYPR